MTAKKFKLEEHILMSVCECKRCEVSNTDTNNLPVIVGKTKKMTRALNSKNIFHVWRAEIMVCSVTYSVVGIYTLGSLT